MAKDHSGRYPAEFMRVASEAYAGEACFPIACLDEKSSFSMLHRFNRFRNCLVDEKHPFGLPSKDLIARRQEVDGQWLITFQPSGLYERKLYAPQMPPEMEGKWNEVPAAEGSDPYEQFMKHGLVPPKQTVQEELVAPVSAQRPVSSEMCLHEWSLGRCLKCGIPE